MIPLQTWLSRVRNAAFIESVGGFEAKCLEQDQELPPESVDIAVAVAAALETERLRYQQEMDELKALHSQQLAQERALWCDGIHAKISTSMDELQRETVDCVSAILLRILSPVLEEHLITAAVGGFDERLTKALRDQEAVSIKITGSAELLDLLKTRMKNAPEAISYQLGPAFELSTKIDGAVLQTKLAPWIEALKASPA